MRIMLTTACLHVERALYDNTYSMYILYHIILRKYYIISNYSALSYCISYIASYNMIYDIRYIICNIILRFMIYNNLK